MLTAIGLLDRDLRNVAGGGQDKIRMINAVLAPVRHSNHKWLERHSAKQFPEAGFHCANLTLNASVGNHNVRGRRAPARACPNVEFD